MRAQRILIPAAVVLVVTAVAGPAAGAPTTSLISERARVAANDNAGNAAVSATGRFVTFSSAADNLFPRDLNAASDVFLRDRRTGLPELISATETSAGGNGHSGRFGIAPVTPDGQSVAFDSLATNLVPGPDTNNAADVFLRERGRFTRTSLVSVASEKGPVAGARGNGASIALAISATGRFVVFLSYATNLVPGDTNGRPDVFVRDRLWRTTTLVSVGLGGRPADGPSRTAAISADGRFVSFDSTAGNLVPGDDNGRSDVFVRDLQGRATERVSEGCAGTAPLAGCFGASMSGDGRFVVYESTARTPHTQAYLFDRATRQTSLVSAGVHGEPGNGFTFRPSISAGGRFVAFESLASNLVPEPGDPRYHVYVRDLLTATTIRASVDNAGRPADEQSGRAAASDEGVVFQSRATNLAPGGRPGLYQVYMRSTG